MERTTFFRTVKALNTLYTDLDETIIQFIRLRLMSWTNFKGKESLTHWVTINFYTKSLSLVHDSLVDSKNPYVVKVNPDMSLEWVDRRLVMKSIRQLAYKLDSLARRQRLRITHRE